MNRKKASLLKLNLTSSSLYKHGWISEQAQGLPQREAKTTTRRHKNTRKRHDAITKRHKMTTKSQKTNTSRCKKKKDAGVHTHFPSGPPAHTLNLSDAQLPEGT